MSSAKAGLTRIRQQEYAVTFEGTGCSLCCGFGIASAKKTVSWLWKRFFRKRRNADLAMVSDYLRSVWKREIARGAFVLLAAVAAGGASAENDVVRLGISNYAQPNPNEVLYRETIETLRRAVAPKPLIVTRYSPGELSERIVEDHLDLLFGSSGFYRRHQARAGFRELVSLASDAYPDPNQTDGASIVVRSDRTDLGHLQDLPGKVLAANEPFTFTGYLVPMGEIALITDDVLTFFSEQRFAGEGDTMKLVARDVLEGRADVGFLRLCMLETLEARGDVPKGSLRVLADKTQPGERCRRSTALYPGWTVSTSPNASPELARKVTMALLEQPPVGKGLHWGIASNYQSVDGLYRVLRLGPYGYLRQWSLERFVERYWAALFTIFCLMVCLAGAAVFFAKTARRRSEELQAAFTRERALEKASREAELRMNALQKIQAVGQLSSMIAHELRQPLTSIRALARGLMRFAERGACTPAMLGEQLTVISEQAQRADAVIERVRSYAKTPVAPRKTVRLDEVGRQAVHDVTLGNRLAEDRITVQTEAVSVHAAADELLVAVVNLLKNALDATAAEPEGKISLTVRAENDRALLTVEDNGLEIPDAVFATLTEPLKSGKATGLGLGLAIVTTIAESHGGRLTFKRCRPGLAVTLQLPRETKENAHE